MPVIGATLLRLEAANVDPTRVKLVRADVFALLATECRVSACFVGFPDPWPGDRGRRRLFRPSFIDLLASRLDNNNQSSSRFPQPPPLALATDVADYADHARELLADQGWPELYASCDAPRPHWRPLTKYEQRGLDAGRSIWDLAWTLPPPEA